MRICTSSTFTLAICREGCQGGSETLRVDVVDTTPMFGTAPQLGRFAGSAGNAKAKQWAKSKCSSGNKASAAMCVCVQDPAVVCCAAGGNNIPQAE